MIWGIREEPILRRPSAATHEPALVVIVLSSGVAANGMSDQPSSGKRDPAAQFRRLERLVSEWHSVALVPAKVQFGPVAFFPRGALETNRFLCKSGEYYVERCVLEKSAENLSFIGFVSPVIQKSFASG